MQAPLYALLISLRSIVLAAIGFKMQMRCRDLAESRTQKAESSKRTSIKNEQKNKTYTAINAGPAICFTSFATLNRACCYRV